MLPGDATTFNVSSINWSASNSTVANGLIVGIDATRSVKVFCGFGTGGTDYLTALFLALSHGAPPALMLSGLMLLMAVITNVVSNNAAAVIGTPVAVGIARELGLPPEPFVLAVLFGANMSYATPMAYKTNLLVMNAGGYTFADFLRIGVPLTLVIWLSLSWLLPAMYGF